jgi:hypothetical protein
MGPHGGGEHLGGQGHEIAVDPAEQHDRPFDQPGHLGEKGAIALDLEVLVLQQRLGLFLDQAAPAGRLQHHLV